MSVQGDARPLSLWGLRQVVEYNLQRRDILAHQLLIALARREHQDHPPRRFLEAGLATWNELKGNLRLPHLLALAAEDTAVRFPLPADLARVLGEDTALRFDAIAHVTVYTWLQALDAAALYAPRTQALEQYARALELPHRFAGADLHKLQEATQVLELPGTGGQLVARALERSPGAYLHVNTTVLTGTWADRAMAGLVAMEWDAPHLDFAQDDDDLTWATDSDRRGDFDLVFGLQPGKGGKWDAATLQTRFPRATVVLV